MKLYRSALLIVFACLTFAGLCAQSEVYFTDFRGDGGEADRQGWHFMRAHTVSFDGDSGMTVAQDTNTTGSLQFTFPEVSLGVGDWMEVSFKFNLNAEVIPSGYYGLRMGLFNHNGRYLTADVTNDPLWHAETGFNSNNTGYWTAISTGTSNDSAQFRYQGVGQNNPLNLNNFEVSPHFKINEPPLPLNDNQIHDIRLRLERVDTESYRFAVHIGSFSVISTHAADSVGFTDTYNTFILFTNSVPAEDFGPTHNRGYTIDDVRIIHHASDTPVDPDPDPDPDPDDPPELTEPLQWLFGTGPNRDGDADFALHNTSDIGNWSLSDEALRFQGGAGFTEASATIDLRALGYRSGTDFAVSARVSIEGVGAWTRFGVIALAGDMAAHQYGGTGFYHGQFRVHGGGGYAMQISDGFPGDQRNMLTSLPMPGVIQDGTYRFELAGVYDDDGVLSLRLTVTDEVLGQQWISLTGPLYGAFEGRYFGFGGRFSGSARIDLHDLDFKLEVPALPVIEPDPVVYEDVWTGTYGEIPYTVTLRQSAGLFRPTPTVVYCRNLPLERMGTDSDEAIIEDLLDDGMVVVELDARNLAQGFPDLQDALVEFGEDLVSRVAILTSGIVVPDIEHFYWLPEGFRLQRELPFWNIQQHGPPESLQYAVSTFNSEVADRAGLPRINNPSELRGPGGIEMDFNMYLDIAYPSGQAVDPVSLVALFSSGYTTSSSFQGFRAVYPLTWLTSGYAVAYIAHPWNPTALYFRPYFNPGPYSLENKHAVASGSAALRFLRLHAEDFNLNGRIGAMGHSKSSYSVVRLADPGHPEQREFRDHIDPMNNGSPEPQPWTGPSSELSVAYASMGMGTRRPQYFSTEMVPFLTACGYFDQYGEWDRFPAAVSTAEALGMHHYAFWMEDLGHHYPVGVDAASGRSRVGMIRTFFDQHLDPGGHPDPLKVFAVIPADGRDSVFLDGQSRYIFVEDDQLPTDMRGVSAYKPISVVFARPVDPDSINAETLQVIHKHSGTLVSGDWQPSLQYTRFQFHPDKALAFNSEYQVVVNPGVADHRGTVTQNSTVQSFFTKIDGVDDGYHEWARETFGEDYHRIGGRDDDPDGDGFTNEQEWWAGTDPLNESDFPQLSIISVHGNSATFAWLARSGVRYKLMASEDLKQWDPLTGTFVSPDEEVVEILIDEFNSERLFLALSLHPAWQVLASDDQSRAAQVIDGNSADWVNSRVVLDNRYPPFRARWVEIQFKTETRVDGIRLFLGRGDGSSDSFAEVPSSYQLQYWDGHNWQNFPGGNIVGNTEEEKETLFDNNISTTAIRFLTDEPILTRVREIEVMIPGF